MTLEFSAITSQTANNDSLSYAGSLLTHDLNGDGNLDLVKSYSGPRPLNPLVSPPSGGLAVFYGTGNGQFTAGQKFEVQVIGQNPFYKFEQQQYAVYQTAQQDYQRFVNSLPTGVTPPPFIYPNPPSPPSPTKIGSVEIRSQAIGDVDRDGRPDLITFGNSFFSYSGTNIVISVLKGTGSGFSAAINSPVTSLGTVAGGLAAADFNGDGNLDVAAISAGNVVEIGSTKKQRVSILFGDGTGQFSNEKEVFLGFDTSAVVAADFNGDGLTDLAIGGNNVDGAGDLNPTVSVLLSTGAGTFNPPKNTLVEGVSTKSSSFPLVTADFNSDGKIDVGSGTWYLAGDGAGQFAKAYEFYGGGFFTGDFNSDGKLDVTDGTSVSLGNGTGRYSYPEQLPLPQDVVGAVSGDFDRDGKPDLAQISQNGTITAFLNRTTRSDSLVISDRARVIDASIESGGLILDLKKGTLQIGGVNQSLTGTYNTVRGTEQADRITGSKLAESLEGLAGNDTLIGEDGNDVLSGGFGNDSLTGGKGKDKFILSNGETFFFETRSIPFSRAMGVDRIIDFENGKDKIELYRNTFTAFTGGGRFSFASVGTKEAAQKSRALVTYVTKTGSLFYNQNGAKSGFGVGGQFADFANGLELRAKDFEVV